MDRACRRPELKRERAPRKPYTLTELGRRVLEAETERLGTLVAVARRRTAGEQA